MPTELLIMGEKMTNDDFETRRDTYTIFTEIGWRRVTTLHNSTPIEAAQAATALGNVFYSELGFASERTWETRGPYEAVMADGYAIDGMTRAKA